MAPVSFPRYVEIMWPEKISLGDLEIVEPATKETPGKIRLLKAIIRKPSGSGSNTLVSEELVSAAGGKIGFVAPISMLTEGPFNSSYHLIPAEEIKPESVG
jgi:hypothetical protein